MNVTEFWAQCLPLLHVELSRQAFSQHILPLTVGEENGAWVIYAKNQFAANLVRTQYGTIIRQAMDFIDEKLPTLVFKVGVGERVDWLEENESEDTMLSGSLNVLPKVDNAKKVEEDAVSVEVTMNDAIERKDALDKAMANLNVTLRRQQHQKTESDDVLETSLLESSEKSREAKQKFEKTNLNPDYTFEQLVVGKGNELAVKMAHAIAQKPAESFYNPFFVYGSTGLGKTHLVQAIGHEMLQQHPKANVYYITADRYVKTLMNAVKNKSWESFKQLYLHYDLLIIDDIQFIEGKDRTMEEFFYLFEHFYNKKQQIILTCDQLPNTLDDMDDRLKSRFAWGMTLPIEPPDLEMRMAILEQKAKQVNMVLNDEAVLFMAQNIKKSVRELEGALNRVVARCIFEHKNVITKTIVEQSIQDLIMSNKPISPELIQKIVAQRYNISTRDILGKKRSRNLARPRQMAMALTKELTNLSLPAIGDAFGGRDHTTVLHAIKTIKQLCQDDLDCRRDYNELLILIQH